MRKKVLAFLVISGILMVGYLLAIAGPSPPWGVHDSDRPGRGKGEVKAQLDTTAW